MRRAILLATTISLLNLGFSTAESDCKSEVTAAVMALAEKPNYAWMATGVIGPSQAWSTEGKTEKGGLTYFTESSSLVTPFYYKEVKAVFKGDNAVSLH